MQCGKRKNKCLHFDAVSEWNRKSFFYESEHRLIIVFLNIKPDEKRSKMIHLERVSEQLAKKTINAVENSSLSINMYDLTNWADIKGCPTREIGWILFHLYIQMVSFFVDWNEPDVDMSVHVLVNRITKCSKHIWSHLLYWHTFHLSTSVHICTFSDLLQCSMIIQN